ncbi:unnamed protein product [Tilletia controversa]|uniref:Uncharacterized protein n=3 Tax=Tilletia TaxID=13289 RepID=A0A8X7MWJ3_9BASI|nr:hypothetical protein CF335_g4692 [Tilletia laevis]KAE8197489.1 hypothetical protein CF328_g3824 [Tilletia controversa]KAE8257299.1 hypothetical protein A4X03_0g4722 [Tilletia caries]KAE8198234.1 hypothetical protein CF336_g1788 [Tilletia laevis]KAE8250973.1 hypothetical protein A4X06_0g2866 [Tilletia controversa]
MAQASASAQEVQPFNASEVTQWLNHRFRAIEAEALNLSLPPDARPEIVKVSKPAGGPTPGATGGAGAWGGSKRQGVSFVADVLKAAQAAGVADRT